MTLINQIKKYAKLRGLSLKEVAIKSGMSQNAIYGWKNHQPSGATLFAVASTLGVSVEELTGKTESTPREPRQIDIKAAAEDDTTILSWDGKPIPPEEMEMIRRILDGGK